MLDLRLDYVQFLGYLNVVLRISAVPVGNPFKSSSSSRHDREKRVRTWAPSIGFHFTNHRPDSALSRDTSTVRKWTKRCAKIGWLAEKNRDEGWGEEKSRARGAFICTCARRGVRTAACVSSTQFSIRWLWNERSVPYPVGRTCCCCRRRRPRSDRTWRDEPNKRLKMSFRNQSWNQFVKLAKVW